MFTLDIYLKVTNKLDMYLKVFPNSNTTVCQRAGGVLRQEAAAPHRRGASRH
jgi:hypothetical protein